MGCQFKKWQLTTGTGNQFTSDHIWLRQSERPAFQVESVKLLPEDTPDTTPMLRPSPGQAQRGWVFVKGLKHAKAAIGMDLLKLCFWFAEMSWISLNVGWSKSEARHFHGHLKIGSLARCVVQIIGIHRVVLPRKSGHDINQTIHLTIISHVCWWYFVHLCSAKCKIFSSFNHPEGSGSQNLAQVQSVRSSAIVGQAALESCRSRLRPGCL